MHSRVAAVKAPRTHNCRRVTGSSGRRREGGESERQRPNMSRRVFTSAVLLLLVATTCCGTGGAAQAAGQLPVAQFEWKDANGGVTVDSLGVPGLLKVENDVFAVAEAQCTKGAEDTTNGIASQLLTMEAYKDPKELLNDAKKTHFLGEGASHKKRKVDVKRPTAVVEGGKIYMLVGQYSGTPHDICQGENDATQLGLFLVKGEIGVEKDKGKKIHWNDTHSIPCSLFKHDQESWKRLVGGGGSGVKMKDGTLVLPVEGTKKINKENSDATEKDEKTVSLIIYTLSSSTNWTLSKGMSADGCGVPSVVEWKDKLMMMTACDGSTRRVYESGDKGESWTEALGTLSRVWGNNQRRHERGVGSGFITATIDDVDDNRKVMLITLPVYAEDKENGVLHLWLTDNTHIVDIGPVSGNNDAAASSLLYKSAKSGNNNEDELIALYEKKKDGGNKPSPSIFSVLLTAQLQQVKDVLKTWKEVDDRVSKLCPSKSDARDLSTNTPCSSNFNITDGLVGFLSDNISETTWRDEYLGVNATINNTEDAAKATKASDGVTFRGAWAEWPVGKQGENQLYHFANYNFTLVATVSIDGEPTQEGPIPLMGVRLDGEGKSKLMELSYEKEKKWILLCGGETNPETLINNWEPKTKDHVVILIRNDTHGTVYVDGQRVGEAPCQLENSDPKEISHFYIGGGEGSAGSQEGVSVTVRNVLLYNRPLSSGAITTFNTTLSIPKAAQIKTVAGNTNAAPLANQNSEVPVVQAALQNSPQTSETQQITKAGGSATTQQVPAASKSHVGGAHGDGGTYCGSGLSPLLLLLLGLWGFAAL
ncbi:trans-sialidase, putative [Trypanosoma cruzi marinkellei]|uniref:Trans-sialidase, putative n=1 Tax=Trypanosoma cruzi marinkellei TaxID=85056 RepID=K2MR75_TRYCR|nr:trans-sialidase, putative [Trypanosoma cruzi marinkellei]